MILNLDPVTLSGLSGPEVLQLVIDTVQQERDANIAIAETIAIQETGRASEVALAIAAQIRARP